MNYTLADLALLVDHTNLHPDATREDMAKLCREAKDYGFRMVAINSCQSKLCSELLEGSDVHTGAAIGFPLGQTTTAVKVFETKDAIANGANEIDYVVNLTEVKAGNWDYIADEMRQIVALCDEAGIPSKVIFENCLLTDDEKVKLCQIANEVRPTFVKTSTGFSTGGATVEDVKLMREHCVPEVQVKAAGGIRDADAFLEMVRAGATRIGTSSGMRIIDELRERMAADGVESYDL